MESNHIQGIPVLTAFQAAPITVKDYSPNKYWRKVEESNPHDFSCAGFQDQLCAMHHTFHYALNMIANEIVCLILARGLGLEPR